MLDLVGVDAVCAVGRVRPCEEVLRGNGVFFLLLGQLLLLCGGRHRAAATGLEGGAGAEDAVVVVAVIAMVVRDTIERCKFWLPRDAPAWIGFSGGPTNAWGAGPVGRRPLSLAPNGELPTWPSRPNPSRFPGIAPQANRASALHMSSAQSCSELWSDIDSRAPHPRLPPSCPLSLPRLAVRVPLRS